MAWADAQKVHQGGLPHSEKPLTGQMWRQFFGCRLLVALFGVWQLYLLEDTLPPAGADDFWDCREWPGVKNSVNTHRLEKTWSNGSVFVVGNADQHRRAITTIVGHGDDLD